MNIINVGEFSYYKLIVVGRPLLHHFLFFWAGQEGRASFQVRMMLTVLLAMIKESVKRKSVIK